MSTTTNTRSVEQVANAVLYEGYLLYPYRASALKNQQRWNFGVIYPKVYSEAQGAIDPWAMQTQCLVVGGPVTAIRMKVRFLRLVERIASEGQGTPWQEAAECEIEIPECCLVKLLANRVRQVFSLSGSSTTENSVTRCQRSIEGMIEVQAEETARGGWRITVRVENLTPWSFVDGAVHQGVLLQSLISTHTILYSSGGEFVSLLDPPEVFREAAAACKNVGTWPVLAGQEGQRNTLLSSPIILYDYPQIAPESPGELFDGTEIDEILTLRILTMTDDEKNEVRQTDERVRKLLDRTEALKPEDFMKLHGVLRVGVRAGGDG
jgi:hypothetical protein